MCTGDAIEPFAVAEVFVNEFSYDDLGDGNITCVGYRWQRLPDGNLIRVVVARIVMPKAGFDLSLSRAVRSDARPLMLAS